MNKVRNTYILNVVLFVLEVFSNAWMMSGITLFNTNEPLTASRLEMFKYFTVDSNCLMGIIALIVAIQEYKILKGEKDALADWVYALILAGTVGVTLTMLVTIFYLAPTMGGLGCFANSNFFLHLINPILSIVIYVGYEKKKLGFKYTFVGLIPVIIYAIYYVGEVVCKMVDGQIATGTDWYGFFVLGPNSITMIIVLMGVITYLISYSLWRLNRIKA